MILFCFLFCFKHFNATKRENLKRTETKPLLLPVAFNTQGRNNHTTKIIDVASVINPYYCSLVR